jgi:hypothetical protein
VNASAARARLSPGALSQSELSGLPAGGCRQFLSVGFCANAIASLRMTRGETTRRSCEWRRHVSVGRTPRTLCESAATSP